MEDISKLAIVIVSWRQAGELSEALSTRTLRIVASQALMAERKLSKNPAVVVGGSCQHPAPCSKMERKVVRLYNPTRSPLGLISQSFSPLWLQACRFFSWYSQCHAVSGAVRLGR